jgi:hypothetical protein
MSRPLLMRVLSGRLRRSAFHRLYLPAADRWRPLFTNAPLELAPDMKMDLVPSDFMHAAIAFTGEYEPELSRRVAEEGKTGGLFVDVGANVGYFPLIWATRNPSRGKVHL